MRKGSRFYWSWIVTFLSLSFTPVGYGYPSYSPGSVRFLTLCRGTQRWGKFWLKLIRIHEKINYLFVCAFQLTVTGLSFRPGIVERGKELARERENYLTRENVTRVWWADHVVSFPAHRTCVRFSRGQRSLRSPAWSFRSTISEWKGRLSVV